MPLPSQRSPPARPVTAELLQRYKVERIFIPFWPCGLELNDEGEVNNLHKNVIRNEVFREVIGVEKDSLGEMLLNINVTYSSGCGSCDILYIAKSHKLCQKNVIKE